MHALLVGLHLVAGPALAVSARHALLDRELELDAPVPFARLSAQESPDLGAPEPSPGPERVPPPAPRIGRGPRLREVVAASGTMLVGDALIVGAMAAIIASQGDSWDALGTVGVGALVLIFASPGFAAIGVALSSDGPGSGGGAYLAALGVELAFGLGLSLVARSAGPPGGGAGQALAIATAVGFLAASGTAASWAYHAGAPPAPAPSDAARPEPPPPTGAARAALSFPVVAAAF